MSFICTIKDMSLLGFREDSLWMIPWCRPMVFEVPFTANIFVTAPNSPLGVLGFSVDGVVLSKVGPIVAYLS
jgi:hypothetical protein